MRTHHVQASCGERWLARGLRAVLIGAAIAGSVAVWNGEARAQTAETARLAQCSARAAAHTLLPRSAPAPFDQGSLAAQRADECSVDR
jgi:hypothetical protein